MLFNAKEKSLSMEIYGEKIVNEASLPGNNELDRSLR